MSEIYDVDYFIRFFKSKPAKTWCTFFLHDEKTGTRCAMGHCGVEVCHGNGAKLPAKARALSLLFNKRSVDQGYNAVTRVNNHMSRNYNQREARSRILAALQDIKNGKVAK